ncbi:MAG: AmmeMemoRadiSam system radical SAM enzyme [Candidatus Pacebacteria bacterium]|nr:AmmeMemoRadiSam system radical SAM enzyme [Candidatus Paceibacterota bacterium]
MKEALLYQELERKKVKCLNCPHYCVLEKGKRGICGVKENIHGKLYSLNYGRLCALNLGPIEKKPFFHFLPGTQSLSLASVGCNFACHTCQNWHISQAPKINPKDIWGEEVSSKEVLRIALSQKVPSISYTYTEPTIFSEFALDCMKLAKKYEIKNNWVSNGYFSKELFKEIAPYLDAINVDLKSFEDEFFQKYCGGRLHSVLDNLKKLKEKNIWIEVTTLVVPTLNDKEEIFQKIAKFIKENLGEETPWHITQFCGAISWKLQELPDTPVETLVKTREIGLKEGLKFVYIGNVPGIEGENTYCPKCKALMIKRIGYFIQRFDKNGKCSKCGEDLYIID